MEKQKTGKQFAKEAKMRMKNGFWKKYKQNLEDEILKAKEVGVSESKVVEYYTNKTKEDFKRPVETEGEFYLKVKKILDEEGEVSDVLGRLTDNEVFNKLSYEEKQRYNLSLSEKYLKAVERYNNEKSMNF